MLFSIMQKAIIENYLGVIIVLIQIKTEIYAKNKFELTLYLKLNNYNYIISTYRTYKF